MADNDLKKGIEAAPDTRALASNSPFVTQFRLARLALGSAQPVEQAESVEEEKTRIAARKTLLREQAAWLKGQGL